MNLPPVPRLPDCPGTTMRRPSRRDLLLASAISALLSGCGGGGADDSTAAATAELLPGDAALPRVPLPTVAVDPPDRVRALAATGSRLNGSALVDGALNPGWAYYTDPASERWYISDVRGFSEPVDILSLGPLVGNEASWWLVAKKAMTGDASTLSLRAATGLSRNTATTFRDEGRGVMVTDTRIVNDRRRIEGTTVPVKWFFTVGRDGVWYIVADPGYSKSIQPVAYQFAAANGDYDWRSVNLDGTQLMIEWKDSRPVLRMLPVPGWAEQVLGQSIDMDGWYGAQCVDLFHSYLDTALGIPYPHGFTGNAYRIFQEAADTTVKTSHRLGRVTFIKHIYRAGAVPQAGDVVFWSAPDPGHVAIVLSADAKTLTTMDQNWVNSSASGSPAARVVHPHYNHVAGWLRPSW